MNHHRSLLVLLITAVVFLGGCATRHNPSGIDTSTAGSPEQPQNATDYSDHPGRSISKKTSTNYTQNQVRNAIKSHIEKTQLRHHGLYPIRDERNGRVWTGGLIEVHTLRFFEVDGDTIHFGAATFRALGSTETSTIEVDYWLKPNEKGKLIIYEKAIHRVDGRFRYRFRKNRPVRASK